MYISNLIVDTSRKLLQVFNQIDIIWGEYRIHGLIQKTYQNHQVSTSSMELKIRNILKLTE